MKFRGTLRKEISGFCRQVSFSQTAVTLCETEATVKQEQFLHHVFKSEICNREESRKARFLKEASFPVYKTFDKYDFKSLKLPGSLTQHHLKTASFVREKKNIVMYGQVGTGKSHLAVACGVNACQQDIPVKFFTVAELVVRLSTAMQNGTLEKLLKSILKAELIILDEWGYVPLDRQGAQLLFRIISDSYERRSITQI